MLRDGVRNGAAEFGRVYPLQWGDPRGVELSFVLGRLGGVGVAVGFVLV